MFESVLDTKRLPEAVQKLSDKLNAKVIGQERAIKQIIKAYTPMTVNMHREGRPLGVFLFMGPTGVGKCLAPETEVLMFDGTVRRVDSVNEGDLLMGPDSKPRRILNTVRGEDQMYTVIPTKGESYTVNSAHILSLKMTGQGRKKRKIRKSRIDGTLRETSYRKSSQDGKVVNISVLDYMDRSNSWKHIAKGYRVGVDFEYKDVSLDPYFLGLWLGDGNSSDPAITTTDVEIHEYLEDFATREGLDLRPNEITIHITSGKKFGRGGKGLPREGRNPLLTKLKQLQVIRNKHVPIEYKTNSKEIRLQVLAGLIDSDGSPTNGGYDFVSKSEQLANDVVYIARSLGLAAYVEPSIKRCQTGAENIYYRVGISGDCSIIPVLIDRKKQKPRRQKKDVLRTGIKVIPDYYGPYVGFTLDGDGLFLLADFTVTHNTETVRAFATALLGSRDAFTRIDCVEFEASHEVSKLLGSPPGYVGYSDKPRLTQEAIDRFQGKTPESKVNIVLFDEIEKAHDKLFDTIMTILGDGRLTLGSGAFVDFTQTFVFLTSNLGSDSVRKMVEDRGIGFQPTLSERADMDEQVYKISKEAAKKQFRPEFINRLDSTVVFRSLSRDALRKILQLELEDLQWRIWKSPWRGFDLGSGEKPPAGRSIIFHMTDAAKNFLLDEGTSELYGARELNRAIDRFVGFPMATLIASEQLTSGDRVKIEHKCGDKDLTFSKMGRL